MANTKKTFLAIAALGVLSLAGAGMAAFALQPDAKEVTAALDDTYIYFVTPWNNGTSDIHVWNTKDDGTEKILTKAADYVWKIERSAVSGYANFNVRGSAGTWDDGQTGNLKFSVFEKADLVKVFEKSTGTDRWSLFCTGNSWQESADYCFTFNSSSEVKLTGVSLEENDTLKVVKIYNPGDGNAETINYYGYAGPLNKSGDSDAGKFKADGEDNIVAKEDGVFSFFFNMGGGNNSIWITDADKVAIDGWATGFIGVTDFCDVDDTDWETYAGSFEELSPKAQGYFNDATADAGGNNVAKAAYRYDNAVNNHGKTPFTSGGKRPVAAARYIPTLAKSNENQGIVSVLIIGGAAVASIIGAGLFAYKRKERE